MARVRFDHQLPLNQPRVTHAASPVGFRDVARALAATLLVALAPSAGDAVTTLVPRHLLLTGLGIRLAVFGTVTVLIFVFLELDLGTGVSAPKTWFRCAIASALVFVAFPPVVRQQVHLSVATLSLGIFLPATIEETVFRFVLPLALARVLNAVAGRKALWIGFILAQIAFATAHIARDGGSIWHVDLGQWLRLFSAGLLYSVIASRFALWIAMALHAWLNVRVLTGTELHASPSGGILFGACVLSAAVLYVDAQPFSRIAPEPDQSHANPPYTPSSNDGSGRSRRSWPQLRVFTTRR